MIETSRPVKLKDFAEHYRIMSADSDFRFSEEYEELKHVGRDQLCTAADLPVNRPKNRFTNILPYDHSRVKLQPTDDEEGSDGMAGGVEGEWEAAADDAHAPLGEAGEQPASCLAVCKPPTSWVVVCKAPWRAFGAPLNAKWRWRPSCGVTLSFVTKTSKLAKPFVKK